MDIALTFAKRQTPSSQFSHWTCSDEDLVQMVRDNFHNQTPGYREGVILVPVNPEGFFSGVVKLQPNQILTGSYVARREGEEPRKSVFAVGEKMPAKRVDVVLYRRDVLDETNERSSDSEWEIISVNASPELDEPPIQPMTLIANHFQMSGGTKTNMSPEEFESALRVSVEYWKDKALCAPIE